ncbi:hypothetical protein ACFPM0_21390 [Pseudonocardia sulfidoxydans]|uniref:hypothetical protein n=1 Tax=Pseudonocardia sulfidoxydans TaxID=54011 RepID=UPI00360A4BBB
MTTLRVATAFTTPVAGVVRSTVRTFPIGPDQEYRSSDTVMLALRNRTVTRVGRESAAPGFGRASGRLVKPAGTGRVLPSAPPRWVSRAVVAAPHPRGRPR